MSNVNDYLKVMRQTGIKAAATNPNSETEQLKRELIEHYKTNKLKAEQLIKTVEASGEPVTNSPMHKLHYEAAVIAIKGNTATPIVPINKINAPTGMFGAPSALKEVTKEDTLRSLYAAGWKPIDPLK